jgi:alginate O-acetyltransferase complex protein AlgI
VLFNSEEFIFVFLPITFVGFYLMRRFSTWGAVTFLVCASVAFYSYWNIRFVPPLALSLCVNYLLSRRLSETRDKTLLALGVAFNLALLGYFKYFNFFVSNVSGALNFDFAPQEIILPIAISFYTFQNIAYLVDIYHGKAPAGGLRDYLLFITFFPHLIAGPLVHHAEMLPQFSALSKGKEIERALIIAGLTIFIVGLFKKVVIADSLVGFVDPVFARAELHKHIVWGAAWAAALAFTLQIYFDFSGYSDMAIGLALLFGIRLPMNFNSPYKSYSIIEFWRRWHITLSRFLRDYLYIPLGGNRKGNRRRYTNLLTVMFLGGLWHGAGWPFVIWGTMHGAMLSVNHLWRKRPGAPPEDSKPRFRAWLLTFFCVVVTWVFFRAASLHGAWFMLRTMFQLPSWGKTTRFVQSLPTLTMADVMVWLPLVLAFVMVVVAPNSQEIVLTGGREPSAPVKPIWQPSPAWAVCALTMFLTALYLMDESSAFIYFQF